MSVRTYEAVCDLDCKLCNKKGKTFIKNEIQSNTLPHGWSHTMVLLVYMHVSIKNTSLTILRFQSIPSLNKKKRGCHFLPWLTDCRIGVAPRLDSPARPDRDDRLVAMICPLAVVSRIWLPAPPAASDTGMEMSCCVPLPAEGRSVGT